MKKELKPCPFCGGNAYIETFNGYTYNSQAYCKREPKPSKGPYYSISRLYSYIICCSKCDIKTKPFETIVKQSSDGDIEITNGRDEAIKYWNSRKKENK